jgi:hypothetical protein
MLDTISKKCYSTEQEGARGKENATLEVYIRSAAAERSHAEELLDDFLALYAMKVPMNKMMATYSPKGADIEALNIQGIGDYDRNGIKDMAWRNAPSPGRSIRTEYVSRSEVRFKLRKGKRNSRIVVQYAGIDERTILI